MKCSATGTAAVADATSIRMLAERRVKALVKKGYRLVESSIETEFGKPVSAGAAVVVPVTASARQVADVDESQVRAAVKGRSLDDARAALAQYGSVDISVTPAWAATMPSFDFRIDVKLVVSSPSPSASDSATPPRTDPPPVKTVTPPEASPSPPASESVPPASPSVTESPTPDLPTPTPPPPTPTPTTPGSVGPSPSASAA